MVASLFLAIDVIGGSTEKPGSQAGPGTQTHSSTQLTPSNIKSAKRPDQGNIVFFFYFSFL